MTAGAPAAVRMAAPDAGNWSSLRGKHRSAGRADGKPRENKPSPNAISGFRRGREPRAGPSGWHESFAAGCQGASVRQAFGSRPLSCCLATQVTANTNRIVKVTVPGGQKIWGSQEADGIGDHNCRDESEVTVGFYVLQDRRKVGDWLWL